jgi:biopolymer transport protein ExbD
MRAGVFIPMIDLAFLSLAAIVAILTQTEVVHSLPVDVSQIKAGIATVEHEQFVVITITGTSLYLEGRRITLAEIGGEVDGGVVLLRAAADVPTDTLVSVMAELAARDAEIRIEVEERRR